MKTAVHVLFVILTAACNAFAAPGDLDTTFGSGGKVTTSIGVDDEGYSIAVQSDGRILVAGLSGPDKSLTII